MARPALQAQPREITGKKVKKLRQQGLVPGNVSGHNITSVALSLDAKAFDTFRRRHDSNTIVDLIIGDQPPRPVLLHQMDRDHRLGTIAHVQFHQVNLNEKITAQVPIIAVGESPLVRVGDAIVLQTLDHVTVSCLPGDLPHEALIHLDRLTTLDAQVHVRDLHVGNKPGAVEVKTDPDEVVLKLTAPQMREVAEDIVAEETAAAEESTAAGAATTAETRSTEEAG